MNKIKVLRNIICCLLIISGVLSSTSIAGAASVESTEIAEGISLEIEFESELEIGLEATEDIEENNGNPIDFESLWRINTDIYAWIRIPGTVIDYPVLQSVGEEDFYLHHNIEGEEDIYGCIYSQRVNNKDFSDFHTILYGHNMRDDTMFGWLSEFLNLNVLWNHGVIYIYLPDKTLEYWVFAAYVTDNAHQLYGIDTTLRKDRQGYLDKIESQCEETVTFDRRLFSKITADSHILTLSTCYQNDPEHRFLLQAVLVEQPDPGTLTEMDGPITRPETEEAESETEISEPESEA